MKQIKIIITAILISATIFSLSSCSSVKIKTNINQNSNTYIENEDSQNYIDYMSTFVKVDDGYYFTSDARLFYFSIDNQKAYPVCSKANCDHNDSDCQAYLSPDTFYPETRMYYYDNNLYLLGRESKGESSESVYLYQISLDNYRQKKAAYLFDCTGGISLVCTLHRGYIYFTYDGGEMKETTATLYRTKLGNLKEKSAEKVFEFKGIGASIARLSAYGNNLFFNTSSYSDTKGNGYKNVLNYLDIHTLKDKTIPQRKYSHFVGDGRVYYCKDENTICYFDLNTKKHIDFCNIKGPCYISADNNYVYFDNLQSIIVGKTKKENRKIFVYDKLGKYITNIIPKSPEDNCFFGGNDIIIFKEIIYEKSIEAEGSKGYYVFNKSQITSSDKQFTDME